MSSSIDHELSCQGHGDSRVINSAEEITDTEAYCYSQKSSSSSTAKSLPRPH